MRPRGITNINMSGTLEPCEPLNISNSNTTNARSRSTKRKTPVADCLDDEDDEIDTVAEITDPNV